MKGGGDEGRGPFSSELVLELGRVVVDVETRAVLGVLHYGREAEYGAGVEQRFSKRWESFRFQISDMRDRQFKNGQGVERADTLAERQRVSEQHLDRVHFSGSIECVCVTWSTSYFLSWETWRCS